MEFSIYNTSLKGYYCDLVGHLGEMSLKLRDIFYTHLQCVEDIFPLIKINDMLFRIVISKPSIYSTIEDYQL